jgi:uncharacterized protein YlaI
MNHNLRKWIEESIERLKEQVKNGKYTYGTVHGDVIRVPGGHPPYMTFMCPCCKDRHQRWHRPDESDISLEYANLFRAVLQYMCKSCDNHIYIMLTLEEYIIWAMK